MPDLERLNANKERIINTIRLRGPSFPARISKDVQIQPLFVAAILAELVSEKRLRMSNMKVGSSPIYHLPGQENLLENFSQYLNPREREAHDLLKQSQILEDEKQQPVIRVALRAIKDFAVPISVKIKGETKTFWKHSSVSDEKAKEKIQFLFSSNQIEPKTRVSEEQPKKETSEPKQTPSAEPKPVDSPDLIKNPESPPKEDSPIKQSIQHHEKEESLHENPLRVATKKLQKQKTFEFPESVKDYLQAKDVEILEEFSNKKKELVSKVRTDTLFGKQEYLMFAKEKKKITEQDLMITVQKAQEEKMLGLLISPGDPDKNAKEYLKNWRNLIKFEKINL